MAWPVGLNAVRVARASAMHRPAFGACAGAPSRSATRPPGGSSDAASRTLTGRGLLDTGKSLSFVSDHTNRLRGTPTITGVACGDTCPYNGSVTIDWDPHKAAANIRDHEGVSFAEAATVLNDEFALTREDSDSEGDNDSSLLA